MEHSPIVRQAREDVFWDKVRGKQPIQEKRTVDIPELRDALSEMLDQTVQTAVAAR